MANSSGRLWQTRASGEAGQVIITEISASRIKGTFECSAAPFPGTPATGTLATTSGQFDIAVPGTAGPVSDNTGSRVSATFNGVPFFASYVNVTNLRGTVVISILNNLYNVAFILDGVTATGDYTVPSITPSRAAAVVAGAEAPASTSCCWVSSQTEVGLFHVESLSADRMVGTFELTLVPSAGSPATAPLVITDGSFDLGLIAR